MQVLKQLIAEIVRQMLEAALSHDDFARLYTSERFTAVALLSERAARKYCAGTEWCIAHTQKKGSFQTYAGRLDRLIVVLIDKLAPRRSSTGRLAFQYGFFDDTSNTRRLLKVLDANQRVMSLDQLAKICNDEWTAIFSVIDDYGTSIPRAYYSETILEDPRSDPLITVQGTNTRGPSAGMEPNSKTMVGKYHVVGDGDEEGDEEDVRREAQDPDLW